jgi:hypothetical protein
VPDFVRRYVHHRFDVFERVGLDAFQVLISELLVNPALRERYRREILEPTFAIADAAVAGSPDEQGEHGTDPRLITRAQAALVLGCLVLRLCGEPLLNEHWSDVPDVVADMIATTHGARHVADSAD